MRRSCLKQMREDLGITQIELAVRSGLQPSQVCRYERGVSPNKRNAQKLASTLNWPVEEVFPEFRRMRDY